MRSHIEERCSCQSPATSFLRRANRRDQASDGVERLSLKTATRWHAVRKGIPPGARTDARRRLPAWGGNKRLACLLDLRRASRTSTETERHAKKDYRRQLENEPHAS